MSSPLTGSPVPEQQIQASASPKAFANVYHPGDEITLHASVPKGELHWQWIDGFNQIIEQGQTCTTLKLKRKLDQIGQFSLVLQQTIDSNRIDTRRLLLAVLPKTANKPHERIGICAHFEAPITSLMHWIYSKFSTSTKTVVICPGMPLSIKPVNSPTARMRWSFSNRPKQKTFKASPFSMANLIFTKISMQVIRNLPRLLPTTV
jgi:hypothetical protein